MLIDHEARMTTELHTIEAEHEALSGYQHPTSLILATPRLAYTNRRTSSVLLQDLVCSLIVDTAQA